MLSLKDQLYGCFLAHWENMVIGFYLRSCGESNPLLRPLFCLRDDWRGECRGIAHILSIFEERDKSLRAEHVRTENKQEAFLGAACIHFFAETSSVRPRFMAVVKRKPALSIR